MLRIGLTGGIAAGKSAVARRFAELGAVLVDADVLAREVVQPGSPALHEIVAAFGADLVGVDGALDRPALGRLVFADTAARERLNAIVHPRVRERAAALVDGAPEDAIVVEDIPLLVESGQAARFHLVVVVDAPDEVRVDRMVRQRGMDPGEAGRRIAAQAPRADRLREADAVLPNDRALEDLLAAADALWDRRIVPFRDNLVAGAPGSGLLSSPSAAGLPGTVGLARRTRARLAAALPPGASVGSGGAPGAARDEDDVVVASVRVTVEEDTDPAPVASALAAAGYPRDRGSGRGRGEAHAGLPAVHRAADPALDVTVTVASAPAPS
ncbi:dephospho-CoA kinase [Arthrobacter sp. MDT2-16]